MYAIPFLAFLPSTLAGFRFGTRGVLAALVVELAVVWLGFYIATNATSSPLVGIAFVPWCIIIVIENCMVGLVFAWVERRSARADRNK